MRRCKAQPFVAVVALVAATTAWAQGARPFADLLLQVLDIRSGSTVAEVGAGRGDFAFRMAEAVGPKGRVYANEVAQDNVAQIERAGRDRGVSNLVAVLGDESDPRLSGPVDRIVMIDVYHHLARPAEFMGNLRKYLNPGGRLAVAAVVNKRNPQAKPSTSKTHDPCVSDPEETKKAIEQAGFVFETLVLHEDPVRSYFWPTSYILVFRLPAPHGSARRP